MRLLAAFLTLASFHCLAQKPSPLPVPTGKFTVGRSELKVGTESVILWYPAQSPGKPAPYTSIGIVAELKKSGYYDQTPETIQAWSSVTTHSAQDAKPISDRAPLLIFLPGAGVVGFQYTSFAEDLASRGFVVALLDYFSPNAPKRSYGDDDFAAMENDMARGAVSVLSALNANAEWHSQIDFDRVGILGHSIGGAAAIAAARSDHRFIAASDMDGAPFGDSTKGTVVPLLVLRSKPIYSDADLAKRGSTRAQWDKKGEEARKVWLDLQGKSGNAHIDIWAVKGTGHFSYTDAPFVMPDAITRFGGEIIPPERGYKVITSCLAGFFDHQLGNIETPPPPICANFEEVIPGIPPPSAHR